MSISLFFGLPGCGKSTLLAQRAQKAVKSCKYRYVYTNVDTAIEGVTKIDNDCVGIYDIRECKVLIDEATLFADCRNYKEFQKKSDWFLQHRHFEADVEFYTQQWDSLDKRIRAITDRVYYVYKTPIIGKLFTRFYRIPYDIIIPDPKKNQGGEKLGEIVQGYCKPPLLCRIFSHWIFRPKYYHLFDSFSTFYLPPLPEIYNLTDLSLNWIKFEIVDNRLVLVSPMLNTQKETKKRSFLRSFLV